MNKYLQLIYRYHSPLCICSTLILYSCTSQEKTAPPAINVECAEVVEENVHHYIETFGNIAESVLVQVRPQVQGILLKAYVKEGDFVKKDDLLYEIDSSPYKAALNEAQATLSKDVASLDLAKNTVERYSSLASKNYISPLAFDQYSSNVKIAEAQVAIDLASLELAKINLGYCKIVSPIDGKVSIYNVHPGNFLALNDTKTLIEIRQISPINVQFSIPQRDFQEIQKTQTTEKLTFELFLPYDTHQKFEGLVYFIDNHINVQSGTVLLKGVVPNKELILWPGEFVKVRLFTKPEEHSLVVPNLAIQAGQQGVFVYLITPEMTVKTTYIATGQKFDSFTVITSGLKVGDRVVTNGQLNLRNGTKVTITRKAVNQEKDKTAK